MYSIIHANAIKNPMTPFGSVLFLAILPAFYIFFICTTASGQQIIRSSVSSSGNSAHSDSFMLLRQTIGQSSPSTTAHAAEFGLRQGFQQPIAFDRRDLLSLGLNWDVHVFPNPAKINPTIDFIAGVPSYPLEVTLWNTMGIRLYKVIREMPGRFSLEMKALSPGTYLLMIRDSEQRSVTKKIIIL
jgi:hypothetical protein